MNQTRKLLIVGIALIFAAAAALVASNFVSKPKAIVAPVANVETEQVLVANREIRLGDRITAASDVRWMPWPKDAVTAGYITRKRSPKADADFDKSIAKSVVLKGEPITDQKLIKCTEEAGKRAQCEGGAMAAILPAGMRAISTKITEDSSAGRFILPNDMVDVILTRRARSRSGQAEEFVSDTLFQNVRVLAIGQSIETKDGKKTVEGSTATLELAPNQAEQLALAKSMGEISLSLRSLADLRPDQAGPIAKEKLGSNQRGNGIRLLRYGVGSRAYGVN